jgi:hypothetical protein
MHFDTCKGVWLSDPVGHFSLPRFAVTTHSTIGVSPFRNSDSRSGYVDHEANHFAITCGGTTFTKSNFMNQDQNIVNCEAHSLSTLLQNARSPGTRKTTPNNAVGTATRQGSLQNARGIRGNEAFLRNAGVDRTHKTLISNSRVTDMAMRTRSFANRKSTQ